MSNSHLTPASEEDRLLLDKVKMGDVVSMKFTRMRNPRFFRKWWALVNLAYDYWEPPELPADPKKKWLQKVTPEKNFERFRKDLIILAGYYVSTYRIDGSVRIEAQSISFANMSEEEFEKLYSATLDVVLKQIYKEFDGPMLDTLVDQVMSFAA